MGKTALITGASRGIGAEIAKTFANNGYNVIINFNNSEQKAKELENQLNKEKQVALAIKADVSNEDDVVRMFKKACETFGNIDVLVNNAAISEQKMLCDVSKAEFDNMFAINMGGVFLCTKEALKTMVSQKHGKIINISSIWGICGASCEVVYSATKSAIIGFTKAVAKEVGPSGITVNCIAPGVIATEMNSNLSKEDINILKEETPLGIIGQPSDIAKCALFIASNGADFITGQIISPNGGFLI